MIHNDTLDGYMRKFRIIDNKCPPFSLISIGQQCCYCVDCFNYCAKEVKEYQKYYKVGRKKFMKEDLDDK